MVSLRMIRAGVIILGKDVINSRLDFAIMNHKSRHQIIIIKEHTLITAKVTFTLAQLQRHHGKYPNLSLSRESQSALHNSRKSPIMPEPPKAQPGTIFKGTAYLEKPFYDLQTRYHMRQYAVVCC